MTNSEDPDLRKPTDLDLLCLQRQGILGSKADDSHEMSNLICCEKMLEYHLLQFWLYTCIRFE